VVVGPISSAAAVDVTGRERSGDDACSPRRLNSIRQDEVSSEVIEQPRRPQPTRHRGMRRRTAKAVQRRTPIPQRLIGPGGHGDPIYGDGRRDQPRGHLRAAQ